MKVTYLDSMGDDLAIVNAAKVSNGKRSDWDRRIDHYSENNDTRQWESEGWTFWDESTSGDIYRKLSKADQGLIQFLARGLNTKDWNAHIERGLACATFDEMERFINDTRKIATHFAPFTKTAVKVHIECPLFVAAQLFKHQVGFETPSSISYRYVEAEEFYVPDVWRKRAEDVKQGSSDEDSEYGSIKDYMDKVKFQYQDMLDWGVAPEQARMVLPQSTITEFIWQGNVAAWARLFNQRTDSHAQKETQEIAKQIGEIIEPLFPVSWRCLTQ